MRIVLLILLTIFCTFAEAQKLPKPDHIVIVIFENASYEVVVEQKNTKFIKDLIENHKTALFTQSFGLTHPSQPNYIKLFSGDRQGVYNDSLPKNLYFQTPNLGALLISKGYSFCGYSEDLPSVGFNGEKYNLFARKHCPWINWQGQGPNSVPPEVNRPFSDFPSDFSKLPTVSFVIPNLEHDMHEPANTFGAIFNGDKWLKKKLSNYIEWAEKHNSLLIVTFDEDDNRNNNHIPTFITGGIIKKGSYNQHIDHYDVLRTLCDMYELTPPGKAAEAHPVTDCWQIPEVSVK